MIYRYIFLNVMLGSNLFSPGFIANILIEFHWLFLKLYNLPVINITIDELPASASVHMHFPIACSTHSALL
jgi:hypothetical protein